MKSVDSEQQMARVTKMYSDCDAADEQIDNNNHNYNKSFFFGCPGENNNLSAERMVRRTKFNGKRSSPVCYILV